MENMQDYYWPDLQCQIPYGWRLEEIPQSMAFFKVAADLAELSIQKRAAILLARVGTDA